MLRNWIFSKGPVIPLVILIITCIISLPFLMFTVPYKINVRYDGAYSKSDEGITAIRVISFKMKEGYHDKSVELKILDCTGVWEVEPPDHKRILTLDSHQYFRFRFTIPSDSQDDDIYFIKYKLEGNYKTDVQEILLFVDSSLVHGFGISPSGVQYDSKSGEDFVVHPEIFIPETIMAIGTVTFFVVEVKERKLKKKEEK